MTNAVKEIVVDDEKYIEQRNKTIEVQLSKYRKELEKIECKRMVLQDLIASLVKQVKQ